MSPRFTKPRHAVRAVACAIGLLVGCDDSGGTTGSGGTTTTTTTAGSTSSANGSTGTSTSASAGGASSSSATSSSADASSSSSTDASASASASGTGGSGGAPFMQPTGTADYPAETEPDNDAIGTPDVFQPGTLGFTAASYPSSDVDHFLITIPPGAGLDLLVQDAMGNCQPFVSFTVEVSPVGGAPIVSSSGSGCPSLNHTANQALSDMPGGDYIVKVTEQSPEHIALYRLKVTITEAMCGDDVPQFNAGEQCDDQNFTMGDGCANDCMLEGMWAPEVEANDTQPTAQNIDGFTGALGAIGANNVDFYAATVTVPGSSIEVAVDNGLGTCWFDSRLTLFNPAGAPIVVDDDGGVQIPCSKISPAYYPAAANLPTGVYAIEVEGKLGSSTPFYAVRVTVRPPGCGDTLLQPGEQCDDDGTTSGDGCSAGCQSESPFEIEPNDSVATATPLWPATTKWRGAITPLADHDHYEFTLPAASFVSLTTHDPTGAADCTFDSVVHLLDGAGSQIAQDDDSGPGTCSSVSMSLPAGNYTAWVQRANDNKLVPAYQLDLSIQ